MWNPIKKIKQLLCKEHTYKNKESKWEGIKPYRSKVLIQTCEKCEAERKISI